MSKVPQSPLLGYNNNVRHKNRVFHIQTEDSGVKYGHIITHLFMDGGRILKSVKTSYGEYTGNERMADIVREMMKQQHKAMFIALRDGKFDEMVDGNADASVQTKAIVAESQPPPPVQDAQPQPRRPTAPRGLTPPPMPPPMPPLAPPRAPQMEHTDPYPVARADTLVDDPPHTMRTLADELTLDIDALERAAEAADGDSAAVRPPSDLPPPPANLFRERTATGKYRTVTPLPEQVRAIRNTPPHGSASYDQVPGPPPVPRPPLPPSAPPPPRHASQGAIPANASSAVGGERRYAPTRPASIFGQARPQQGKTIFGEDLISDKSLDEVILSYLADDLDPQPSKK
jgi:hypothetical protein